MRKENNKYIIVIKYYKEKTKEIEILDWYNTGDYIVYKTSNGAVNQVKKENVIMIKKI